VPDLLLWLLLLRIVRIIVAEEGNKIAQRALRSSYVSTVVSISLVLFVIGVLAILILNARQASDYFKENLAVNFVIKSSASEQEIRALADELQKEESVKDAVIITKEEAAEKLSEELNEDFVKILGTNPLLPTIDVTFHAGFANKENIGNFVEKYNHHPQVMEVRYEETLVENLVSNIKKISLIIIAFGSLLFFIMMVLINNTIRLTLYAKRFLIKSMQLVGATRGFIRWPFLARGMLSGLYGAIIANILLLVLLLFVQRGMTDLFGLTDIKFMIILFGIVLASGIFISTVSTWFAVNRYLRKSFDDLF